MGFVFGSRTEFKNNSVFPNSMDIAGIDQNHFIIAYNWNGNGHLRCASISGLTPTFGTEIQPYSATVGSVGVDRVDDNYGVCFYGSGSSGFSAYVITRSGTTLSVGTAAILSLSFYAQATDMCMMSSTLAVFASSQSTVRGNTLQAATVDTSTTTITPGTATTKSAARFKYVARMDNFDSTYGIIATNTPYQSVEQLLLFSVSGTTITTGSYINLSASKTERAVEVVCINSTQVVVFCYVYDSSTTTWEIHAKLFTRTALTLTETSDITIMTGVSSSAFSSTTSVKISAEKEDSGKVVFFIDDKDNHAFYAAQVLVNGTSLSAFLTGYLVDYFSIYTGTGDNYPRMSYLPGATTPSAVFTYLFRDSNYPGVVKVGNPTWGSFIPRVMLI